MQTVFILREMYEDGTPYSSLVFTSKELMADHIREQAVNRVNSRGHTNLRLEIIETVIK